MATIYRVLSTPVWVRSEPSINGEILGVIYRDEQVEAETQVGMWIKHAAGYSCLKDSTGKDLFEKVEYNVSTFRMMRSTRAAVSVGMAIRISQSAKEYTNAHLGTPIPQWVKDRTHIVSQISGDGQRVLLGHPNGINSWVWMKDVYPANDTSSGVAVPEDPNYEEVDYENDYKPEMNLVGVSQSDLTNNLKNLRVKTLRGIHGMPYQYMPICDTRINGDQSDTGAFGRKYAEKIVARMPLLLITPGDPQFLSKFSKNTKKSLMEQIINFGAKDTKQSELEDLLTREGKYYSLKFNFVEYYNYVNPMCRAAARFLGIHNVELDGTKLDNYNWYSNTNPDLNKALFSPSFNKGAVPFYIHSDNQINESFSNSTTESQLATKTNSMSDLGREINFIMGNVGTSAGMKFDKMMEVSKELSGNIENLSESVDSLLGTGNIFSNIANSIKTVTSGGKLIFPEIWSDSDFSRSYSVKIKLTTPDNDKLSWYLNICVPLMHLIGLAVPRQTNVNGLISPFLIRAMYKGLFNVDMGIITRMDVSKGEEGAWTKEGLPTVVEVDLDIKDLYSAMTITSNSNRDNYKYNMMNNIILMDYIANMCGININDVDIGRTIDMYFTQNIQNKITDAVRVNLFAGFDQWATNSMVNIYSRLFR